MSHIIGLIGFKQVGKSTAAKHLEEKYGFVRHNMKDALIAEIKQNFPLVLATLVELYKTYPELWKSEGATETSQLEVTIDNLFVVKPILVRELMKNYGTEVRRRDRDSYWVDKYKDGVEYLATQGVYNIVTDDVRFLNEAKAIKYVKNDEGIFVRFIRPDITTGGNHKSETEQLSIEADYTVECYPGEYEKLYRELDKIVENLTNTQK